MGALDELLATWRKNPSASTTIALCSQLIAQPREPLAREIGEAASRRHATDPHTLQAVGRMYLATGLLAEAQHAFVAASKIDATDPEPYRLLGEVLLRRGDAVRAERVLARALDLGGKDQDTVALRERAHALVSLQQSSGVPGVAAEVAKSSLGPPRRPPGARPAPSPRSGNPSPVPASGNVELSLPSFDASDATEVSEVYAREGVQQSRPARVGVAGQPRPATVNASRPVPRSRGQVPPPPPQKPARAPEPSYEDATDLVQSSPSFSDLDEATTGRLPNFDDDGPTQLNGNLAQALAPLPPPPAPPFARGPSLVSNVAAPAAAPAPLPVLVPAFDAPTSVAPVSVPVGPSAYGLEEAAVTGEGSAAPIPAIVLEHLSRVGVFDPSGGVTPAWEAAPKQKTRGVIPLLALIVVVGGAGIGGYEYTRRMKAERAEQAVRLNREISAMLHSGKTRDLRATDEKLSKVFDLDSRSREAARLWLENRVLGALLLADETRGLDSAVYRGREAGLSEKELAVGRVASFLIEGDLAGAAALLPKWDADAAKDAHYQLAAGAVLERAGDPRAAERFDLARSLDPKLVPADVLLARLLLLEYGLERARPVLDGLYQKLGADDPTRRALGALTWVVDPARPAEVPAEARFSPEDSAALPFQLRAVPAMVAATEALHNGDRLAVGNAIHQALAVTDSPALATSLGFVAIESGNEVVARKAALKALSFAALYPRARTLAARVALLGGRIDEAQKAVEGLDPKSSDVGVVRSVVAYENADAAELNSALLALGPAAQEHAFEALTVGAAVLSGQKVPNAEQLTELSQPSVAWGEAIAADAALDSGNLELAEKLLATRIAADTAPVYQQRVARLRRYQKRLDDALGASERALGGGTPSPGLIVERTLELLEKEQAPAARDLIARHPTLLGPAAGWLNVLVDMASNQPKQAVTRLATLEPPAEEAPGTVRILAARALVTANDKRGRGYLISLVRRFSKHPDVQATAALLNGK